MPERKMTRRDALTAAGAIAGLAGMSFLTSATARAAAAAAAPAGSNRGESFFFLQMADSQLFWGDDALDRWKQAIASANRLKPAFVIVCGDLLNRNGSPKPAHAEEDQRRAKAYLDAVAKLDKKIPLYNVAGNHDVGNNPTPETLAWYEARFGTCWYTFRHGNTRAIVLESDVLKYPKGAPAAARRQMAWLAEVLKAADTEDLQHRLVFMHHPMCKQSIDEGDNYFTMPKELRAKLLALFHAHKVQAVFSGHFHGNLLVKDAEIELVTTSAVAKSLRKDPPGFRIVRVTPERVEHEYYAHEAVPAAIDPTKHLP